MLGAIPSGALSYMTYLYVMYQNNGDCSRAQSYKENNPHKITLQWFAALWLAGNFWTAYQISECQNKWKHAENKARVQTVNNGKILTYETKHLLELGS